MKEYGMQRLTGILALVCLLLAQAPAWAALTGASVSPGSVNLPHNRAATLTLNWTVTAGRAAGPTAQSPALLVTSPGSGVVLLNIPRPLQRAITPGTSTTITETVQLSRSQVQALLQARDPRGGAYPHFELHRIFSDTDNSVSAAVSLYPTGGGGQGMLDIGRLALYFDDMSTTRLVSKNEEMHALLEVQFAGSGQLHGVWEIADPASTLGEPIYRPLRTVRQTLVGNQALELKSPPLPTGREGMYLLRFTLTEPRTGFEPVFIRYLVSARQDAEQPPRNVQLQSPGNGALIDGDTEFGWSAQGDASAYQLEIHAQPARNAADKLPDLGGTLPVAPPPTVAGPPLTGMLVTGEQPSTRLSKPVWQHLQPGQRYWWRVRAIGPDGSVTAESALAEFRTP
jgi:hypothetical protein